MQQHIALTLKYTPKTPNTAGFGWAVRASIAGRGARQTVSLPG